MKTIIEVLNLSTDYLKRLGIQGARRQAEELISDALGMNRVNLYMDYDRPLTEDELEKLRKRLTRRGKGEPLAYIHGEVEFHGCKLTITPDVLIPRQETEILVSMVIKVLEKEDLACKTFWDICCGSGCIGIAIKKQFPQLNVKLLDICPRALRIAHDNAKRNGVDLELIEGDLLEPLLGQKTEYLVCNPPYVSEVEYITLDKEVKDFEPKTALVAEKDGLDCYFRISEKLEEVLEPHGKAWFEIGYRQGPDVVKIFEKFHPELLQDWSEKDRFVYLGGK